MKPFAELRDELDQIIEGDEFVVIVAHLVCMPKWKLIIFYPYTYLLGETGAEYRECIKCLKFWYYLRWQIFKSRYLNRFFR